MKKPEQPPTALALGTVSSADVNRTAVVHAHGGGRPEGPRRCAVSLLRSRIPLVECGSGESTGGVVMWEIEQLNADQLRTMFGVERGSLGTPGFPGSERDSEGEERWPADQVWQWVASR
jgi:hypothetical protein